MTVRATLRPGLRLHPRLVDAGLAVLAFLVTVVAPDYLHRAGLVPAGRADVALGAIVCGTLALRRRWPLGVLVVVTFAAVAGATTAGAGNVFLPAVALAAYTVGTGTARATAVLAGGASAAMMNAAAAFGSGLPWFVPQNLIVLVCVGAATVAGIAVRTRQALVAALEDRARRAEQTRAEESRRRVVQERLRIARELHDVVAHRIAVVNVQAGVAAHVLPTQPDEALRALHHIRTASRAVLEELSVTLGVLRQPDERDAPVEPTPGMYRLSALVSSRQTAGLHVECAVTGEPKAIPAGTDIAAYRIVEESLANAYRHAPGSPVRVAIRYAETALLVEVRNAVVDATPLDQLGTDLAGWRPAGPGHGILGMHERAAAVGGSLQAGPERGAGPQYAWWFAVRARLPLPEGEDS